MGRKKGQITLFTILGIVLVIIIIAMVYYKVSISEIVNKNILQKNIILPTEVDKVQQHVQRCVDITSKDLLYQLGIQGGLLRFPETKGITDENISVAYGYYNGQNILPSLADFKREFSNFMNVLLPQCLNIGVFEKVSINPSTPATTLDLLDNKVRVSVKYPISVSEGESVYKLDQPYKVEYPLRIKFLHDLSDSIVKNTASDPKNIDVSYLLTLDAKVDAYPYDSKTFIYSLEDDKSVVDNVTYKYQFAVR